ncbi:MAG: feruloyl-CoA synthase [Gammaproteobacteria bacterium]|nr:feruloyl-CoA synthase [Gammaproteobacteria bacterium]MBU1600616.1 feruloyl-CoA synthase [Gammaproteobacteria bacterium]MBU2435072.1 feruloyl-CoA synthase [Gammaproteobacteria bacterium]MBU2448308.1 feruloyl-CoA synthase [Gammaproteobacteria bacterium]
MSNPSFHRIVAADYRPVSIGHPPPEIRRDADGGWHIRSLEALGDYPVRLTDRLVSGARQFPERTLMAARGADGEWIRLSYAEMLRRVRCLGQGLLDRGLSVDRPLLVLSGNDLEHIQLMLAAMYVGIPYSPVSPAYSLVATDFGKLRHIVGTVTPGLVYAADGDSFAKAIAAAVDAETGVILGQGKLADRNSTSFAELLATEPRNVDAANAAVGPETIAKFLFTSGSTKLPKAVVTTQRMLCANQQMLLQTFPVFGEEPPVLIDWLPWNHTFGGSHNVGIALYNGGSFYIDDGQPTPKRFGETLRNLRDISPTVYFNVPKAWEDLTVALEQDAELREVFFSRLKLFFFAGAGLSQAAWDRLDRVTEAHCGHRILMMAGLGMTETSPSCTFTTGGVIGAGYVGLPAPGCEVKLVPVDGKLEARMRGPHVMPGYWRNPEQTREVFDDEGYYCTGDALKFVDEEELALGLVFDGRIAEDFKLSSGTFVSVGPLRAKVITAGAPYVQDVVVAGMNRDQIGMLVFARLAECRQLAGLDEAADQFEVMTHPTVRDHFRGLMAVVNQSATGSANRIAWIRLLETPPSIDHSEITDKGSINQRAVLTRRAELIEAVYSGQDSFVIDSRG